MMVAELGAVEELKGEWEMERMVPVLEEKRTVTGEGEKVCPLKRWTEWMIVSAMTGVREIGLVDVLTLGWENGSSDSRSNLLRGSVGHKGKQTR
jgi:hypothetical protein